MQLVVFKIGQEEYGFNIRDVQEIVRRQKNTEIPNMPFYMEGIISLRGRVIPVISIAKKFGLECKENSDTTRLIVLNLQDENRMAVKADEVTEVLTVEDKDIDEQQGLLKNSSKESCLTGIVKIKGKVIILLDSKKILDAEGRIPLEGLEAGL